MTTLTKGQFRFLLLIYCAFIVAGMPLMLPHRTPLTAADVAEAKRSFGLENLSDSHFALFMIWLLGIVLVASLVGILSLFLFWRPGVYIFVGAVCARVVIEYLQHITFTSGWWYGGLELLFELAIVALVFIGPARTLFQSQHEVRI